MRFVYSNLTTYELNMNDMIFSGLFFIFYLAFGASIFSAIESPIEKQEMEDLVTKKADFLQNHPCVTGKTNSLYHHSRFIEYTAVHWSFSVSIRSFVIANLLYLQFSFKILSFYYQFAS